MLLLAIAATVVGVVLYEVRTHRRSRATITSGYYPHRENESLHDSPAYAYYVPIRGR